MYELGEAKIVDRIADRLKNNYADGFTLGLFTGKAGILLFLKEYDKFCGNAKNAEFILQLVRQIKTTVNSGLRFNSVCRGAAGILWLEYYLRQEGFSYGSFFDDTEIVVRRLYQNAHNLLQRRETDYLHGAIGILTVLGRCNLLSKQQEEDIVAALETCSIKTPFGISWNRVHSVDALNDVQIDIGMAHGVPSIVNLVRRFRTPQKVNLLTLAINDLYHRFLDFSNHMVKMDNVPHNLSWCSSPMGTSIVLLKAFRELEEPNKFQVVEECILHIVRQILPPEQLFDTSLCHGSSGLTISISELQKLTGASEIKRFLVKWQRANMDAVIGQLEPSETNRVVESSSDYSILTGSAGKGLAILNYKNHAPCLLELMNLD